MLFGFMTLIPISILQTRKLRVTSHPITSIQSNKYLIAFSMYCHKVRLIVKMEAIKLPKHTDHFSIVKLVSLKNGI